MFPCIRFLFQPLLRLQQQIQLTVQLVCKKDFFQDKKVDNLKKIPSNCRIYSAFRLFIRVNFVCYRRTTARFERQEANCRADETYELTTGSSSQINTFLGEDTPGLFCILFCYGHPFSALSQLQSIFCRKFLIRNFWMQCLRMFPNSSLHFVNLVKILGLSCIFFPMSQFWSDWWSLIIFSDWYLAPKHRLFVIFVCFDFLGMNAADCFFVFSRNFSARSPVKCCFLSPVKTRLCQLMEDTELGLFNHYSQLFWRNSVLLCSIHLAYKGNYINFSPIWRVCASETEPQEWHVDRSRTR